MQANLINIEVGCKFSYISPSRTCLAYFSPQKLVSSRLKASDQMCFSPTYWLRSDRWPPVPSKCYFWEQKRSACLDVSNVKTPHSRQLAASHPGSPACTELIKSISTVPVHVPAKPLSLRSSG